MTLGLRAFLLTVIVCPWTLSADNATSGVNPLQEKIARLEQDLTRERDKNQILGDQVRRLETLVSELKRTQVTRAPASATNDKVLKLYGRMDPIKAAKVLEKLSIEEASTIVGGLNQSQAAEILSEMEAEFARKVTANLLNTMKKSSKGDL